MKKTKQMNLNMYWVGGKISQRTKSDFFSSIFPSLQRFLPSESLTLSPQQIEKFVTVSEAKWKPAFLRMG